MRPSQLALGAMNFGKRTGEAESQAIIDRAVSAGISVIDTANVYNDGESERVVGRALRRHPGKLQVATKVGLMRVGGRVEGLSRARVLAACDESLQRLGIERIDVYYLHAPDRAPEPAPIEETLGALGELLAAGKIAAFGISNFASWQILEMNLWCDAHGVARPVKSQVIYNLAIRQLEIEYFKFAARHPIHTTVYNALAGGLLSGRHRQDVIPTGSRFDKNPMYQRRYWSEKMFAFAAGCAEVAGAEGISPAELAYAWLAGRPGVDSVLIGPASVEQLEVALSGTARTLSAEALARLEELGVAFAGTDASYCR
jgi:aryl-alcohol dehydrogenase-like predicted oxidoreductase